MVQAKNIELFIKAKPKQVIAGAAIIINQWISGIKASAMNRGLVFMLWITPAIIVAYIFIRSLQGVSELATWFLPSPKNALVIADSADTKRYMALTELELKKSRSLLEKNIPKSYYLVINTTENNFRLYQGKKLVREGICSTGSMTMLSDGNEKKWFFETPRGMFKVRDKRVNPVWKKPDWAFVEQGLPIPSANHPSRIEYGTLGDYALSLGDGYLIHGTLYQRFLGMPVTHGCVRLGDDDLKAIYNLMPVGSRVYIY